MALNILIGCEFSGVVRDAFRRRGHNAVSCDLVRSERAGPHLKMDIFRAIRRGWAGRPWDMMIAFPPCDFLTGSGARWISEPTFSFDNLVPRQDAQDEGIAFFLRLMNCDIPRIALENPVGVLSTEYRQPDQIIQPHYFGSPAFKKTCLWLKNLPALERTHFMRLPKKGTARFRAWAKVHHEQPGPDRKRNRSRLDQGIAFAMADQWSKIPAWVAP